MWMNGYVICNIVCYCTFFDEIGAVAKQCVIYILFALIPKSGVLIYSATQAIQQSTKIFAFFGGCGGGELYLFVIVALF